MYRFPNPNRYQTLKSSTVAKGIVLRMTALGAVCGFGLGMIYGVVFPMLASWLNAPGSLASAAVIGLSLGILFGWVIGGMFGLIWGLVTGLCTGLALAAIILYLFRDHFPAATYPATFTVVSLMTILTGHLILLFVFPPSYPTIPHWLLNVGLPFIIMALAFGIISYVVGSWARDKVNE